MIHVDQPDFFTEFNHQQKTRITTRKLTVDAAPVQLRNKVQEKPVSKDIRDTYEQELKTWITNDQLIPDPEGRLGPPMGLVPYMAVMQHSKGKVPPVMDYHRLSKHTDVFTANADIYAAKFQEQHNKGQM